jgi:hypothetical protein
MTVSHLTSSIDSMTSGIVTLLAGEGYSYDQLHVGSAAFIASVVNDIGGGPVSHLTMSSHQLNVRLLNTLTGGSVSHLRTSRASVLAQLMNELTDNGIGAHIVLSDSSIEENASVGDVIGTLSVTNGSGSYTFTITLDPDSKFSITGTSLKVGASLDYETAVQHSVTIQADNGVDTPLSRVFTIAVTDIDDSPRVLTVGTGTFVLTGQNVTLTYSGAGDAIAGPVLVWVTDSSDNTPEISLTEANSGDLAVGRTVVFQRDTVNTFDSGDLEEFENVIDSGEDMAGAMDIDAGGAWDDNTWYVRARIDDTSSGEWSNIVSQTIAVSSLVMPVGTGSFALTGKNVTLTYSGAGDTTTGLVSYWPLDDESGTTAVDAQSGHDLAIDAFSWGVGYYDFTGSQYGWVADHADFNFGSAMSGFLWVKGSSQSAKGLISQSDGNSSQLGWRVRTNTTGANSFDIIVSEDGDGVVRKLYRSSLTCFDGSDHSIAWTWGGGILKLYVDAVLDTSPDTSPADDAFTILNNSTASVLLGSLWNVEPTTGASYTGRMWGARLYNVEKSATDISAIHALGV